MSVTRSKPWMTAKRAFLLAIVPLATVCLAQDATAPPADRNAPYALPFGLSCKKCLGYTPTRGCAVVSKIPIMAVVSGAREATALPECYTLQDPHYGPVRHCSVSAALRFDHIEFLRNDPQASPNDRFLSTYEWSDAVPDVKEGKFLHPDKRYLILAGPVHPEAQPKSEWYIASACELTGDTTN